MLEHID
ncbi:uncharacterized protein DNG_00925 [Cephalotrichum gorgonifer]|nr:uncharacterized protein DNG_00925 [Cephalotrichum gorgonifer]